MFHELLIALGLQEPTIYDIMNKIIKSNFTKQQLKDLHKVGPIIISFPDNNSNIKKVKFDYVYNKGTIEFLYTTQYCLPAYNDLVKYLPEIKLLIEEVKEQLIIQVAEYNERQYQKRKFEQENKKVKKTL